MKQKQPPRLSVEITPEVSIRVNKAKKKLGTNRGGIGRMALDYALPRIEAGEFVAINGALMEAVK